MGFSDLRVAHRVLSAQLEAHMKTVVLTLIALTMPLLQHSEPIVSKDSISIHTVRKGNMQLRLILAGAMTSIEPARAVVSGLCAAIPSLLQWTRARPLKLPTLCCDFELARDMYSQECLRKPDVFGSLSSLLWFAGRFCA